MAIAPAAAPHQQLNCFFDLVLVGISLCDHRLRHTVRAEYQFRIFRMREAPQHVLDLLNQRIQIKLVPVETPDGVHRQVVVKQAPPLVQTAPGGGAGILRIKRQQDDLVAFSLPHPGNGFGRERMPVAHSHKAACIYPGFRQRCLQSSSLPLGKSPDGRATADCGVVMLHLASASRGNQLGQRFPPKARKREVNDVRIRKEVKKKRFDRLKRIGPAQLEQYYPYSPFQVRHPHIP